MSAHTRRLSDKLIVTSKPLPARSGRICSPVGTWLSLVEHSLGVRGVGSSNLPVPTNFLFRKSLPQSLTSLADRERPNFAQLRSGLRRKTTARGPLHRSDAQFKSARPDQFSIGYRLSAINRAFPKITNRIQSFASACSSSNSLRYNLPFQPIQVPPSRFGRGQSQVCRSRPCRGVWLRPVLSWASRCSLW